MAVSITLKPHKSAALAAALFLSGAGVAYADARPNEQVISDGKDDYQWQCASCHGSGGKGDGPMAKILIRQPADLTKISTKNDGKFPFWRVYHIISGKTDVPGHETFQMPDFWKRFSGQERDLGFLPPHVRILELTHYIESLQEE